MAVRSFHIQPARAIDSIGVPCGEPPFANECSPTPPLPEKQHIGRQLAHGEPRPGRICIPSFISSARLCRVDRIHSVFPEKNLPFTRIKIPFRFRADIRSMLDTKYNTGIQRRRRFMLRRIKSIDHIHIPSNPTVHRRYLPTIPSRNQEAQCIQTADVHPTPAALLPERNPAPSGHLAQAEWPYSRNQADVSRSLPGMTLPGQTSSPPPPPVHHSPECRPAHDDSTHPCNLDSSITHMNTHHSTPAARVPGTPQQPGIPVDDAKHR